MTMSLGIELSTGVYCIRNKANGKRYVGSAATSLDKRLYEHRAVALKGRVMPEEVRHKIAAAVKGRPKPWLVKLPPEVVEEIRRRYVRGDRLNGACALAREFGVHSQTILAAVRGKSR